jgi:exonuclease III
MTHFISASRQLQQQIKVRQQAVISLQATVRRCLAKAQQNCSAKGWRHCVPLTDRMIQGYTSGVSIFTKRQAPTTNGG